MNLKLQTVLLKFYSFFSFFSIILVIKFSLSILKKACLDLIGIAFNVSMASSHKRLPLLDFSSACLPCLKSFLMNLKYNFCSYPSCCKRICCFHQIPLYCSQVEVLASALYHQYLKVAFKYEEHRIKWIFHARFLHHAKQQNVEAFYNISILIPPKDHLVYWWLYWSREQLCKRPIPQLYEARIWFSILVTWFQNPLLKAIIV
jgi:hypothetical protein